ncbi:hypothetical protein JCM8547_009311 [Rhodosporidiobolus lusitaniae]
MLLRPTALLALSTSLAPAATPSAELYAPSVADKVLSLANSSTAPPTAWPEYTDAQTGEWVIKDESDWTSGFFPSSLYLLHERFSVLCPQDSPGTDFLSLARLWSSPLYFPSSPILSSWTHDVGFNSVPMMDELRLNPENSTAREALLSNAQVLAGRFSEVVGCTRSWDRGEGEFEVIIDNMFNLQLLVAASSLSSNSTLLDMAVSHANKTRENHVRSDGSSFHVVDYSPTTGEVQWRGTAQGLANSSTWSRGQAWGVLGFSLMANATGDSSFLDTSRRMADFFITNLPASLGVSYWDFNATIPPATLDTSASTIAASALYLLSSLETSLGNETAASRWSDAASTLLGNVVQQGVAGWEGASIVGNGTVNNKADPPNNSTGITYGDTYYLQAGNWALQLGLANCSSDGAPARGASPGALSSSLVGGAGNGSAASAGGGGSDGGGAGGSSGCERTVATPLAVFGALAALAQVLIWA